MGRWVSIRKDRDNTGKTVETNEKSTDKFRFCPLITLFGGKLGYKRSNMNVSGFPLGGSHAGEVAEGSDEGFVVGETRIGGNGGEFQIGIVAHELLGVADAVFVDELRDGIAARGIDAVGGIRLHAV